MHLLHLEWIIVVKQIVCTFQALEKKVINGRIKNHHGPVGKLSPEQYFCKFDVVTYF